MRSLRISLGLAIGLLAGAARAEAPPSGEPLPPEPRSSSPVETLESLTGIRVREAGEGEAREPIETDRDSFTPATVIAPRGRFILESAYSFIDNRRAKGTHSFPEFLLRYGATERIELRLGWNAEFGSGGSAVSGSGSTAEPLAESHGIEREYTISYGVKLRVTDQSEWLPRSIVILQGFTPTGGSTGTSTATGFVATYAAGWSFRNRLQLDGSIRYFLESERGDRFNEWAPSVVLRVPLGEKWTAHAEYFASISSGKEVNTTHQFFSPGVHYLVTPDLEVGVRVGWGLNDQSARFFTNVGFGWQF